MPEMTSTQRQMLALCSLISAGDRCDWGGSRSTGPPRAFS